MARPARREVNERADKDRAHALVLKGKFDQAILIYRTLLKHSKDANLWLQLADTLRKRGLIDDAVNAYRSAAEGFEAQGHVARARAALSCALQFAPGEPLVLSALKALQVAASPQPRHLALVPPPVMEIADEDLVPVAEPEGDSLLSELLEGLPVEARQPAQPSLPPEIAAIFATPPPPARQSVDALLAYAAPKKQTRLAKQTHIPAAIAAIFAKPPAPAPARRDTRPPPPVPSLLGEEDEVLDSGFEQVFDQVFSGSADDDMRTDPFCPKWPENQPRRERETVVARPPRGKARVPAYPRG